MEFFIKKVFEGGDYNEAHHHFVRFGKGNYERRFLISFAKTSKIKIRASFELANDLVKFVKENKDVKFSGSILAKEKISGQDGKKKSGGFVYEVSESNLEGFENAYFYLLNVNDEDIVLKIKKKLPKPGKSADKIDDKFCSLDLDVKYWPRIREAFFWDIPEDTKKAKVEHNLVIEDIVLPDGEKDPVKIREFAKRKGKIIRKITIGKEDSNSTEVSFEV